MDPISTSSFRILDLEPGTASDEICCSTRNVGLLDEGPYETLSYVWGANENLETIHLSGGDKQITPTLFAALRRLRDPTKARALWIDQLCIDQSNPADKARQVMLMRHIYRRCTRCIIWFGEIDELRFGLDDIKLVFAFISAVAKLASDNGPDIAPVYRNFHSSPKAQAAFLGYFTRHGNSWLRRIWTVQEALLPLSGVIQCGPLTLPWETVTAAANNFMGRVPTHLNNIFASLWSNYIEHFSSDIRGLNISKSEEFVMDMLHRWRFREATDPRDKVYALMGLYRSVPLPSVQDYSYDVTAEEIYTRVTVDLITNSNSLLPLIGRRGRWHLTGRLPSWALDFSEVPYFEGPSRYWSLRSRYFKYQACGTWYWGSAPLRSGSALKLDGLFVDKVKEVGDVILEEGSKSHLVANERVAKLIMSWDSMRNKRLGEKSYRGICTCKEAFWRTMLSDLTELEFPVRRATAEDAHQVSAFYRGDRGIRADVKTSIRKTVINQSFFITENGYMGTAPAAVLPGDEVWIFPNGSMPLLIRKVYDSSREGVRDGSTFGSNQNDTNQEKEGFVSYQRTYYRLLATSYVHGIMDGEMIVLDDGQMAKKTVWLL